MADQISTRATNATAAVGIATSRERDRAQGASSHLPSPPAARQAEQHALANDFWSDLNPHNAEIEDQDAQQHGNCNEVEPAHQRHGSSGETRN